MSNPIGAMVWANISNPGSTLFTYIKVGEQFQYKASPADEWFTKTSVRWFVDAQGRKFTTGKHTAVIKREEVK
jgi:hypothetical protein